MPLVPFGEWLPDLPEIENPGALTATNVIPAEGFYRPFPDFEPYSSSLTARCRGAFTARDPNGAVNVFACDATKLYRLTAASTTWSDVSGATYNTGEFGSFAQYGDLVVFTNGSDVPQKFDLATPGTFSALGGSPPTGRFCGVVKDFLVQAQIVSYRQRTQWSGFDNAETWTVSAATQSDYQDLVGNGGQVNAFLGGEYGVVIQERAVTRMDYVGPPTVFQFTPIEQQRGTRAPGSVAAIGSMAFFLAEDGFYMFNGAQCVPIGQGKIDKTFLADFDGNYELRVTSGIDPINKVYAVAYPGAGHTSGDPNKILLLHWPTGRWAIVEKQVQSMFPSAQSFGYTLDSLDGVSGSVDALPFSLDSVAWAGGSTIFAGFDTSHRFGFFTGSNLAATLDTREAQLYNGARGFVTSVRPMVDGGSLTARCGVRDRYNDSVSFTPVVAQNTIGECPQRANARYHRARVGVGAAGTWNKAVGVDFSATQDGVR